MTNEQKIIGLLRLMVDATDDYRYARIAEDIFHDDGQDEGWSCGFHAISEGGDVMNCVTSCENCTGVEGACFLCDVRKLQQIRKDK